MLQCRFEGWKHVVPYPEERDLRNRWSRFLFSQYQKQNLHDVMVALKIA